MKNLPLLIGTLLGSLLLVIGIAFFFSGNSDTTDSTIEMYDQEKLLVGAPHSKGASNPEVTIVEFSDFQCPACKASAPLVENVMASYGDRVRLVYRHFPLDQIHPNARTAAMASEVVAESGKFWEFHDILFDKQSDWDSITDRSELKQKLADYAAELQIDKASFLEKIDSTSVAERVQNDVTIANDARVNATPTFFVNGQKVLATELLPLVESLLSQPTATSSTASDAAEVKEMN